MIHIFRCHKKDTNESYQAVQVSNDNLEDAAGWCEGLVVDGLISDQVFLGLKQRGRLHYLSFGDYILKDAKNKYHAVRADQFEQHYHRTNLNPKRDIHAQ